MNRLDDVMRSGMLSAFRGYKAGNLGGKYVQELEELFCEAFKVKYAVSMNSATSCLHAALVACGVDYGDKVATTPYAFSATAASILHAGGIPYFCDIEDETFNLDPHMMTFYEGTKVLLPVHLHGHPADMDGFMNLAKVHGFKVVEDASQALGAKYHGEYAGTIGDCGVFSFNQSKPLSTGEGGMLITNDAEICEIARLVRNHGETQSGVLGWNYRLTEPIAAIAIERFINLDNRRVDNANLLTRKLSQVKGLTPPIVKEGCTHVYYTYPVKYRWNDRDRFQDMLIDRGVYFGKGYVTPLYLQEIYQKRTLHILKHEGSAIDYAEGLCPITERMWRDELCVTDIIKDDLDADKIADTIKDVLWELKHLT